MSTNNTNNVNNPMKVINGGALKCSVSLTISKSDTKTVAKIKATIKVAYRGGRAVSKAAARPFRSLRLSRRR